MKHQDVNKIASMLSLLNAALVLTAVATVGAIALLYDRPSESAIEKRKLTERPVLSAQALFQGEYTTQMSNFFADTFPAREKLVRLASRVKEGAGLRFDDVRIHEGAAGDVQQAQPASEGMPVRPQEPPDIPVPLPPAASASESAEPLQQSSEAAPSEAQDDGSQGVRVGAVFIYQGKAHQIFGGSDAMGSYYAQVLNAYQQAVGDRVQIYNIVIPLSTEFALPQRYQSVTTPQLPRIEHINSELDPSIKTVDAYSALSEHRDEYIYFSTDHHWTSLGAYYAYREFCAAAGFEPVELDTLEKRTLPDFLGTLYAQTQDSKLLENPDHVDYYMMPVDYRCYQYRKNEPYTPYEVTLYGEYAQPQNSYSVFLHGDYPLTRIDTGVANGRKIAVVKESYGNAFVPFLVNNYEQILVVDQRYLQIGLLELLEQYGVNELLFINNIFAAQSSVRISELQRIMDQQYVPPEPELEPDAAAPEETPGDAVQESQAQTQVQDQKEEERPERKNGLPRIEGNDDD